MVRLFCVIVGVAGSAFSVEIGRDQTVGDLKKAVKTKNKIKLKDVDAGDLQLFLTMSMDGEWLRSDASDVISMRSGAIPEQVRKLMDEEIDPAEGIGELFGNDPPKKTIHVLVRVPDYDSDSELIQQRKRKPLEKLLKESKTNGELPQKGDFLKLFNLTDDDIGRVLDIKAIGDIVGFTGSDFYVRKEILCVLENFKKIYHDEFDTGATTTCSKQFILMGSPGTGKSCILALICFYIAVVYDRPVVWHRQVEAGFGVGTSTRLFYQGKYYEWDDAGAITYADFYRILQVSGANVKRCWFCLDGMSQKQIRQKSLFNLFRLLTTSGHYSVKAEASEFLELCLVPYWRQEDLEDFGKHEGMLESDVAARFFESGGSLRDFHQLNFAHVKGVLGSIQSSSHAMSLLTNAGLRDVKEIDCIRMRGVENRNNADHYVDMDMWTCCVTSQAVFKAIAHVLKPQFFEKMKKVAMGMDDKRLEGVAFEGYFHVLVRHHQPIRVKFRRYDNGNHRDYPNWTNIMGEPNVIDCNQLSLNNEIKVLTTGKNMEDCAAEMEEWAANPSKMDYWTPATSLCDTIDAVAKWTLPDDEEHFCLLQLTMATKHKCDEEVLWKLAQPFVAKQLNVCYIALLHDEAQLFQFRLDPVQIKKREILDNVPLYVGHFEKVSDFIARE